MNVRKLILPLYLLLSAVSVGAMDVATNVWYNTDWCEDLPWVDLIRSARQWTYTPADDPGVPANPYPWANEGAPSGMMVPTDTDGYPLQVPYTFNGTAYRPVTIMLCQYQIQYYPYGTFTLIFEGKGTIVLGWDAHDTITSTAGGVTTHPFTIDSISQTFRYSATECRGLVLAIIKSDSTDHIRNIHVILPGFADKWQTQPVTPLWVQTYRPFKVIRYMVWCSAFTTKVSHWQDRVTPTTFDQCGADPVNQAGYGGIADEHICDAANAVQRDAWVNIPPLADSNYMWHMAKVYHDHLDTNLRLWIEWANETWLGGYEGNTVAQDSFAAAGVPNFWSYHGVVAARMFRIFSDVFKDNPKRLVKIISGQDTNTGVVSDILDVMRNPKFNPTGIMPDVVAIAPYFSFALTPTDVDREYIMTDSMAQTVGAKLVMYEGGNGTGNFTAPNNAALYTNYMNAFASFSRFFTMFNQFTCIGPPVPTGTWGAKEFISQPIDSTGKYKALYDYIVSTGQWDPNENFQPYPSAVSMPQVAAEFGVAGSKLSASANKSFLRVSVNDVPGRFTLRILNASGRQVALRKGMNVASYNFPAGNMHAGMYVARLTYAGNKSESKSVIIP